MRFGCPFGPSDFRRDYPPKELDVVEFKLTTFDDLASYRRNRSIVLDQVRDHQVIVHAPWQYDLGASTKESRDKTVHMYQQCVDLCTMFDADILVVHPSKWNAQGVAYDGEATREQILQRIHETLPPVIDYARSSGVTVALENIPTKSGTTSLAIGDNPIEFAALVKEMKCRMCFDIGHGINNINGFLEHKGLFVHLHICDMTHDLSRQHLFLGDGEIDWDKYAPQLLAMDLPSIFEFDRAVYSDDDFVRGKHWLTDLVSH